MISVCSRLPDSEAFVRLTETATPRVVHFTDGSGRSIVSQVPETYKTVTEHDAMHKYYDG